MASLIRVWVAFDGDQTPMVQPIEKETTTIGREPVCDVYLPHPSVSRKHATITFDGENYILRDWESANGTYVNDLPITEHILKQHDTMRVGEYLFVFDPDQQAPNLDPPEMRTVDEEAASQVTAPQPVIKKPAPTTPSKNLPVKVIVPHTGSVQSRKTTSATTSIKKKHAPASAENRDIPLQAFMCGLCGIILFIPAIVLGHKSKPETPQQLSYRKSGLILGYIFLVIWIVFGAWYANYSKDPISKNVPTILNVNDLLKNEFAWAPSEDSVLGLLNPGDYPFKGFPPSGVSATIFCKTWQNHWNHGLLLYQPKHVRIEATEGDEPIYSIIMEEGKAPYPYSDTSANVSKLNPWLTPERKYHFGTFFVPSLGKLVSFETSSSTEPNSDESKLKWLNAKKVLKIKGSRRAQNLDGLKVLFVLKPDSSTQNLTFSTTEKEQNQFKNNTYTISAFPAEYLCVALYYPDHKTSFGIEINRDLLRAPYDKAVINAFTSSYVLSHIIDKIPIDKYFPVPFQMPSAAFTP